MIGRRAFMEALAGGLLAAPLAAEAQQGKVYRVGVLGNTTGARWDEVEQGFRDLGYVEGRNVVFVYRWSGGDVQRFPRLIEELVALQVDVIVTLAPAARAAKDAMTKIPIVMANSGDLVGEGIVASLAHPGGSITGLSAVATRDVPGKMMQLLKEVVPRASLIAFLFDPSNPQTATWLPDVESGARRLGLALRLTEVRSPGELEDVFAGISKARVAGIVVSGGGFEWVHRRRIIDLAARHRLPAIFGWRGAPVAGGLMSYGADLGDLARRAATYVDKIFKGAKPGDLPIEQPTKFEFVINLKTAKALGLTIPPSLLLRADQVIE